MTKEKVLKISLVFCYFVAIAAFSLSFPGDTAWKMYREGDFEAAESAFSLLDMKNPDRLIYRYNRGCSAYRAGRYTEAAAAFLSVSKNAHDKKIRFNAFYNLGNAYFQQAKYALAEKAFKKAVLLNPESEDARFNLELALRFVDKTRQKISSSKKSVKLISISEEGERKIGSRVQKKDLYPSLGYTKSMDHRTNHQKEKSGSKGYSQSGNSGNEIRGTYPVEIFPSDMRGHGFRISNSPVNSNSAVSLLNYDLENITEKDAERLINEVKEDPKEFYRLLMQKKQKVIQGKDW